MQPQVYKPLHLSLSCPLPWYPHTASGRIEHEEWLSNFNSSIAWTNPTVMEVKVPQFTQPNCLFPFEIVGGTTWDVLAFSLMLPMQLCSRMFAHYRPIFERAIWIPDVYFFSLERLRILLTLLMGSDGCKSAFDGISETAESAARPVQEVISSRTEHYQDDAARGRAVASADPACRACKCRQVGKLFGWEALSGKQGKATQHHYQTYHIW